MASSTGPQYIARCAQVTDTVFSNASEVVALLKKRGESLGAAESLSGGGLMAAITSISGASAVFRGGVVSYATPLKEELLKVKPELIAAHGVIHAEVSRQMAEGARTITTFNELPTTWGIGTTGVAGPASQDDKPVGMVFIGIASPKRSKGFGPFLFPGNREQIREATVIEALALLWKELRKEPGIELEEDEFTAAS
ncbi:competence-damaged protein-domain-containing protein [Amylocarpus encephaloides]|uniref:Competence-damaged protein-domain-containing protein n=1 Tax=Amylocarpus encephaloides TaxID=45428 RepID=A0A9P8C195_9HELO|nr:competence-damaged protein-domain-containing protein [Amylocarpus encephaloides]